MKIFKNLVNATAETLKEIHENNRYADKAIEHLFKTRPQWGSRDRRFVAECVYDVVRYKRLYGALVRSENNYWFMVAAWVLLKGYDLPDWPEFRHLDREKLTRDHAALKLIPAIAESYPDWLWAKAEQELGEALWKTEATALNQPAQLVLRLNTLKGTPEQLKEKLSDLPLQAIPDQPLTFALTKRENLFKHPGFKEGLFEVQDAGSQQIAPFLSPEPGELVIDACAGAGGKSLHLAALMHNKGRVISMDVEEWKLEELKKRARRAGAFNIETRLVKDAASLRPLHEKADRLLLDVPCSGSGVIRRNPDTKWKLSPESIERTCQLQSVILDDYCNLLKPGGFMVYSTCSIFPTENSAQVTAFLSRNQQFEFVREKTLMPSAGFDGFYMALLRRRPVATSAPHNQ